MSVNQYLIVGIIIVGIAGSFGQSLFERSTVIFDQTSVIFVEDVDQ